MYTVPTTAVNQPDGTAYYTNSKSEENIFLSCRQGPIRFEVMRKNGLNSYTWSGSRLRAGDHRDIVARQGSNPQPGDQSTSEYDGEW